MNQLRVIPIRPERLAAMVSADRDDLGNPLTAWPVEGWEPLRCCLRLAESGEDVEPVLHDLLGRAAVARVHVRADTSQCFTYEVVPGGGH